MSGRGIGKGEWRREGRGVGRMCGDGMRVGREGEGKDEGVRRESDKNGMGEQWDGKRTGVGGRKEKGVEVENRVGSIGV